MKIKNKNIKIFLILLIFNFISIGILLLANLPEKNEIKKEKERLIEIEEKITEALINNDTIKVKTYIIQLKWQVEASTIGGINTCEKLSKIWDDKRKEYVKAFNLNDFIVEETFKD